MGTADGWQQGNMLARASAGLWLLSTLPIVDQLPISMACHPLRTLQVSAVQPFGLLWFCNRIKPKDFTGRFLPWDAIRVGIQQPQIRDEH